MGGPLGGLPAPYLRLPPIGDIRLQLDDPRAAAAASPDRASRLPQMEHSMTSKLHAAGARRLTVVVLVVALGIVVVPSILATVSGPPLTGPAAEVDAATRLRGLGRILRADATVLKRDGATMAVHYERGKIAAVSASSITIKGLDGMSTTFAVSSETGVRERGREIKISDLKAGERAMVFGTKNGSGGYDALLIRCVREGTAVGPTASPTS